MNMMEQAGEALILAQQGNTLLARSLAATVKGWVAGLGTWLRNMPTTLPPTDSYRR